MSKRAAHQSHRRTLSQTQRDFFPLEDVLTTEAIDAVLATVNSPDQVRVALPPLPPTTNPPTKVPPPLPAAWGSDQGEKPSDGGGTERKGQ